MALSLCAPSTSQCLLFPTYAVSFASEWKVRALQSSFWTQVELHLHLGISFTKSLRSARVRSSGIVAAQGSCAENFISRSRSPSARIKSEKHVLIANSSPCEACSETSRAYTGSFSGRVTGVENGANRAVTSGYGQNGTMVEKKVAIVWFKHDLRMDDHPGLASAAQYDHVLPLFILDSSFYAGWSEERLAILFDAVADLRRSLKLIDSTLVIRKGRSKDVLLGLALQVHTMEIIAEEEIEEIWHDLLGSVSASLSVKSLSGPKTGVKYWRAPLYDLEDIEDLPDNYKEFICMRRRVLLPQNASTSLPSLPTDTEPGELPSLVDFIAISKKKSEENPFCEVLKAAQSQSAERLLLGEPHDTNGNVQQVTNATNATNAVERNWINPFSKQGDELPFNSVWEHKRYRIANVKTKSEVGKISGGATGALNMLREYLKALEITHNRRGGRIYEQILELEKRSGASFRAIFNRVLELGTLSRRRVYYEVWFDMIQRTSRDQGSGNGLKVCSWRWRGYLIQYSTLGDEGPAVVLIHGFGAFWEHYRDNIRGLAEKGNRVWGFTMVGFGRSEKPPISYTELLLAELVRDFIVEVVKEPDTPAGNSIGGYTTCVVAGLWPRIVRSLILLNSAGQVVPNYTSLQYRKPREKSFIAKRGAHILLVYLRQLSNRLLKRCYPNRTTRVDAWLQSEVMRPSFDPGSTAVLESIFHLNRPLPLNFYIDRYNGEVLVIQGVRDPLHNATKRAAMLRAYCNNVTTRLLNAGHCPHDEVPDEVNALIHDWLKCSNAEPAMNTEKLELRFLSNEDAAGIVKGESRLIKPDWYSYFSR